MLIVIIDYTNKAKKGNQESMKYISISGTINVKKDELH